jgi:cytochrome c biogenesis protein ResB
MKCLHGCRAVWKSWNHTKALEHVLGGCSDIKQCRFVSKSWREKYQGIRNLTALKRQEKLDVVAQLNMDCDELEEQVRERHSHSHSRSSRIAFVTAAAAAAASRACLLHSSILF